MGDLLIGAGSFISNMGDGVTGMVNVSDSYGYIYGNARIGNVCVMEITATNPTISLQNLGGHQCTLALVRNS